MRTRSKALLATLLTVGLTSIGAATSASAAEPPSVATSDCASAAAQLLQDNGVDSATAAVDYACGLGEVTATATTPDGSEQTFTQEAPPSESGSIVARAVPCDPPQPPTRTIVSELQVDIYLCVVYGQTNSPTNATWARSIDVDWTVYPGWNSAQSRVSTIPSEGSPTLTGTITSQKQNGILPPTELSSALFTMNGNDVATGYVVGGLNPDGSHAVKMAALEVTDSTYSFNAVIGDGETTPRFTCDTSQQRCYYPNGEEAGL
jgi:hypothetical protein